MRVLALRNQIGDSVRYLQNLADKHILRLVGMFIVALLLQRDALPDRPEEVPEVRASGGFDAAEDSHGSAARLDRKLLGRGQRRTCSLSA